MNSLQVISPGAYCSIQDMGRLDYRSYGVPTSGAMDQRSFQLANALVGNPLSYPVLEMLMTGGKFRFSIATIIALAGADFSPMINQKDIPNCKAIAVKAGDVLSFGKPRAGNCCYLAIRGGLVNEVVMGSASQLIHITSQNRVLANSQLPLAKGENDQSPLNSRLKINTLDFLSEAINVLPGPEYSHLAEETLHQKFTLTTQSNRMAYQFIERIDVETQADILTSAVMPGTVQMTPAGQLIILMRDCQTTGGYPRVLQLTEGSIDQLAQKRPGQQVKFNLL